MTINHVILPLFEEPYYSYTISLEGNSYILQFLYNENISLYTFSLYTADSVPIVVGHALIPTYPIFKDYRIDNLTGWFWMEPKANISTEKYKEFPDKINEFYNFFYLTES